MQSNVTNYCNWLKIWFSKKNKISEPDVQSNYFNAGLIDSLDIIDLITSVETEFAITFESSHFQDRRFATIKGLAEIIEEIKLDKRDEQ